MISLAWAVAEVPSQVSHNRHNRQAVFVGDELEFSDRYGVMISA